MQFVVLDLEFNQEVTALCGIDCKNGRYPFEIIQFGAVKLDEEFHAVAAFDRLVKPSFYSSISPFITELTGITMEPLLTEQTFPDVYKAFGEFIGDSDSIICVWGMTDLKELYLNSIYHNLEQPLLSNKYINLQPYTSVRLGFSKKKMLKLSYCAEALGIVKAFPFHNALGDAYYTAEIFKKIYNPAIQPRLYNPVKKAAGQMQHKRMIDFDMLFRQFEKMYSREMTKEEQDIIRLAYQMGKTGQFLKCINNNRQKDLTE